jgi:Domain of unknown function (DUF4783)
VDVFTKCVLAQKMNGLENHLSNTVEITMDNQKNIFSKEKAVKVLEHFLDDNKVLQFSILNSGKSNSTQQQYSIGTLQTSNKTYKVFITVNSNDVITQIQFK